MTEYFTITDCVTQLQHSLLILVRSNLNLATRLTGFIFILPVVTLVVGLEDGSEVILHLP